MRQLLRAALVAAFFMSVTATTASAAGGLMCYPRDDLFAGLAARHGERPAFAGVTADGRLFEVLVGPDGSFTAFISLPEGLACPLAAGEGWRAAPRPAAPPPSAPLPGEPAI